MLQYILIQMQLSISILWESNLWVYFIWKSRDFWIWLYKVSRINHFFIKVNPSKENIKCIKIAKTKKISILHQIWIHRRQVRITRTHSIAHHQRKHRVTPRKSQLCILGRIHRRPTQSSSTLVVRVEVVLQQRQPLWWMGCNQHPTRKLIGPIRPWNILVRAHT